MIAWTILSAFLGALVLAVLPHRLEHLAKWLALAFATAGALFASIAFLLSQQSTNPYFFSWAHDWVPALGIGFHLAADGISLVLVLLTGLLAVTAVLFSWNVTHRPRAFFACILLIIGGSYGVFLSFDLFLFFVFYEIVIVPKYFLISIWGSTNRQYAAMKLTVYSIAASALVLLGILALGSVAGSFDLFQLRESAFSTGFQLWVFPILFLGFAVLAGLWPFHTWAPTGHVAAPTAASMLLAGVVMKLGAYGALRVAMPLLPEGLDMWRSGFLVLSAAGVVYGAFVALSQNDLKFVIGYSSISHMGFVMLGLMTLNLVGLGGAVMQMFSHGIIAALLFAVVGRMIYDRTHTREIGALGSMQLSRSMPLITTAFILASAASMGLPGFSGFIAEISVLLGAWQAFPWFVVVGLVGILLTGAFSLRAVQLAFLKQNSADVVPVDFERLTLPEILGGVVLLASTIAAGLFPQPLLHLIYQGLQTPYFETLFR